MSITQLPSEPDQLVILADFAGVSPARLFDYWTQPALLQEWWPRQAELDPRVGGQYTLSWPEMDWHLRGHYLAYDSGERLAFTWKWDHDPATEPERTVMLDFASLAAEGSRLRLTHGPYANTPEDQAIRLEHHLAGWLHFLPHLQQRAIAATRTQ